MYIQVFTPLVAVRVAVTTLVARSAASGGSLRLFDTLSEHPIGGGSMSYCTTNIPCAPLRTSMSFDAAQTGLTAIRSKPSKD